MKLNNKYLLSPIFIVALVLLLCNDFYFKYAFHNDLTGKISDFAGILVLGFFLHFINDQKRLLNVLIVALFFIYWKSPMSSGFISFWNELGVFQLARVVDYWDLMALILLPVLIYADIKERTFKFSRASTSLLAVLTVFALCSTSQSRELTGWDFDPDVLYEFTTKLKLHEFVDVIETRDHMRYSRQDSLIVNRERVNSYLFVADTTQNFFLDSCRFTFTKKSNRKLEVQVISAGISSIESLVILDLPTHIKRYKLSSKVSSSTGTVIWIK
jgi:hypothetical protein